jgi:hypothetical protein
MSDEQDDYPDQTKHPTIACLGRFSAQLRSATAAMRLREISRPAPDRLPTSKARTGPPADPSRERLRALESSAACSTGGPGARGQSSRNTSTAERCPQTIVSATTGTPPPRAARKASRTRVRNQRRTTTACQRVVRRSPPGTSARLRPRLHHRPAATAPGRRPHGGGLLPGVHRDRQRRPQRPPGA